MKSGGQGERYKIIHLYFSSEIMLNFRKITWALRKLNVPAGNGLVLDVGCGCSPYPRADVLLDQAVGAEPGCSEAMMRDGRPVVFGDANKMPFKDKAFDFVIASHLLGQMSRPEVFLAELQRVGKAGYIEAPNALLERLYPHPLRCLEILDIGGVLRIHKKSHEVEDPFLGNQRIFKDDPQWQQLFNQSQGMFHIRYYWSEKIDYVVLNPEVSCEWLDSAQQALIAAASETVYPVERSGWRAMGQQVFDRWYGFGRARRLKNFDLISILVCPECHGGLQKEGDQVRCADCDRHYPMRPVPDFTVAT